MKTACLVWRWQGKSAGELSSSAPAYSPAFRCQGWHGRFVLASRCLFRPFCILHSSFSPGWLARPAAHGCWMLDVGCWMLDVEVPPMDVGCWMLDVGCWMLR